MPGVMRRSKRPSGAQRRNMQRKIKKERQSLAGSMLPYLKRPRLNEDAGESTLKNTAVPQATTYDMAASSSALHSVEEKGLITQIREEVMEQAENSASGNSVDDDDVSRGNNIPHKGAEIFSDVFYWKIPVPDHFRVKIIRRGSAPFQNKEGPFRPVIRQGGQAKGGVIRRLSKDWFYMTTPDGEKQLRTWMVYSRVSDKLYCFCCRLFTTSVTATTSAFVTGFQNWWKLNPKVEIHQRSEDHNNCFRKWAAVAEGLGQCNTMVSAPAAAMEIEKSKCRHILYILLDITLYLARQNMPFHDHREDDSSLNKGNFLELVEMLSKHDAVLKEHLESLKQSGEVKAAVSFLSPATQNEFIGLLGDHVKQQLVMEIKSAGFFGIMFDSIPDVSQTDQMSEVIRYVKIEDGKVEVKEAFLGFFPLAGKKAANLCAEILEALKRDGLDIMNCRSQGYDNAASMTGIHGGVQALIKEKNPKAVFNGCIDHSLNLCGHHSFFANVASETFFGKLSAVFSFFSASPDRWKVLVNHTGMTVEHLSMTRWSAHYAAVKPVAEKFAEMVEAIASHQKLPANDETRAAAWLLYDNVVDFTFLCFLYFWCDVLRKVDDTQQYLQTKGLSLDKVVAALESLNFFLQKERSQLVDGAIQHALVTAEEYGIPVERRVTSQERMPGEKESEAELTLQEENKRAMLECIDRFYSELQSRARGFKDVASRFEAVQARSLISATDEQLNASIPKLTSLYDEISESELLDEIERLRWHLEGAQIDLEKAKDWAVLDFLKFMVEWRLLESLPNLSRSLRLFLTVCVSVASCERSFSKLKLIKNYLKSTVGPVRLSGLAMLSIESELAQRMNFDEVIDKFAALKARKGIF